MACTSPIECNTIQESPSDIWYLYLGCNNHMAGNVNLFSSLDNSVQIDVTFGNNVQVTVLGKGIVGILTQQGESKFIPDVYHVKGLKHNLMSIGQLIQKGYRVYIWDNHCVIKDKCPRKQMIAKVPMISNRLFPLRIIRDVKWKTNTRAAFKAQSEEVYKHFDKKENGSVDV